MSNPARPRAVLVVDLNARRGVCSNCNESAAMAFAHAACGAEIVGVAINIEYAAMPSFEQGVAVNSKLPGGMPFLGAGRVLRTDNGYRFERTQRPDGNP